MLDYDIIIFLNVILFLELHNIFRLHFVLGTFIQVGTAIMFMYTLIRFKLFHVIVFSLTIHI